MDVHSEPEREVMLWDFAGQDEYGWCISSPQRDDVALLLYDPTKSDDTFDGIDYGEGPQERVSGTAEASRRRAHGRGRRAVTAADIEAYCEATAPRALPDERGEE